MLTGTTNEERIWNYLTAAGLNACGVAGLMGNLYAESGLSPTNLQNTYEKKLGYTDATYTAAVDNGTYTNFVKDSAGYGLAQWTYWSRKQNLLDYARAAGKSVGDLETQLAFLLKELTDYGLLAALKTAVSVREASNLILLKFEKPASMNSEATQTKRASYGQAYYDKYAAKTTTGGTTVATKITTGKELAAAALNVAKNFKTLYVMGCFGAPMTAANKTRYINNGAHNNYNAQASRKAMINAASADTFGFDCVCLIKGLLWGWCGDASKVYGGAGYAINGVPDIGADTMITKCSGVSTDFSKIEVGEAVWMSGHIGIYIGDGLAVECTPSWKNCVQVTACNCAKSGYDRRNWTKHGKLPYVSYTGAAENAAGSGTGSAAPAETKPTTTTTGATEKRATEAARSKDTKLAGTYVVTAGSGLHIRNGAGTNKTSFAVLPKGTKVQNYGFYTEVNGVAWLYVQVTYNGVKYTGFCSAQYLSKQ